MVVPYGYESQPVNVFAGGLTINPLTTLPDEF